MVTGVMVQDRIISESLHRSYSLPLIERGNVVIPSFAVGKNAGTAVLYQKNKG